MAECVQLDMICECPKRCVCFFSPPVTTAALISSPLSDVRSSAAAVLTAQTYRSQNKTLLIYRLSLKPPVSAGDLGAACQGKVDGARYGLPHTQTTGFFF